MPRLESSRIVCVEWLDDQAANLYSLFGTYLVLRIASYTAAASAISYFRRHTMPKIPNSYFQILAGMEEDPCCVSLLTTITPQRAG